MKSANRIGKWMWQYCRIGIRGAPGPIYYQPSATERTTPACRPAFDTTALSPDLAGESVAIIIPTIVLAIIIAAVQVMPAMLAADVMAVNPMMPVDGHVA